MSPAPIPTQLRGAEPGEVTLLLPFQRPPLTMNELRSRHHWATQREAHRVVKTAVWTVCRQQRVPRFTVPVVVRLVWWAPRGTRRDPDSLGAMVKAALDGLTAAKVLADDSSDHVHEVREAVTRCLDNPKITLTITPVDKGDPS